MAKRNAERPVIVCTSYRGVFFGWATDTSGDAIFLRASKMAIYWGTTKGVMQLAETGPTDKSRISSAADITLRGITAVIEVSPIASEAWTNA